MKVLNRLAISVYSLFVAAVIALIIAVIIAFQMGSISFTAIASSIENAMGETESVAAALVVLALLFIISMWIALRGTGDRKERQPIVKNAAGGEIEISLDTFENIAISTIKNINDARDYTAKARKINESVAILIKMSVIPDINIPELGQKIQTQVIEAIENTTGVKVANVKVRIENVASVFKNKVE